MMRSTLVKSGLKSRRRGPGARWLLAGAGAAVVGGAALAVVLGAGPGETPGAAKTVKGGRMNIELFDVARSDFEITTTAMGELRAKTQVEIRSGLETESTITEIVPEGTTVKKGQVLVRLNAESIQQKLDEETLELENVRAAVVEANENYEIQISQNDSDKRAAELKLTLSRLELQKWREGEVESKRQDFDHTLDRTVKEEQRLREYLEKSKKLREKEFYSKDSLQKDEIAVEEAEAATVKARLAKRIYWEFEHPRDEKQRVSDVEQAEAEVDRVVRQNTSRMASKEADKKNKQQAFAIREQKFNKFKEQLDAAVIKAPTDGLVVYSTSMDSYRWGNQDGPLAVGSKVQPQQVLMVLPDTSVMLASVKVHEILAGKIRVGQPVTIKIDALSERRFTGKVESIGIMAEQSGWMDPTLREHSVKIAIDLPADMAAAEGEGAAAGKGQGGLRPSMRCETEISMGKVADAVAVPIQAVYSEGLLHYVNVADAAGTRFTRRPVEVGQRSDRFAELLVGVKPGERILLRKTEPGEVADKLWNPVELAAVGLEANAHGDLVPTGAALAAKKAAMTAVARAKAAVAPGGTVEAVAAAEVKPGTEANAAGGGGAVGAEDAAGTTVESPAPAVEPAATPAVTGASS